MLENTFRAEIAELQNVSRRLVRLAQFRPTVAEQLLMIAGNVSSTATILAVLLETKLSPEDDSSD